jgi:hypothetical protein
MRSSQKAKHDLIFVLRGPPGCHVEGFAMGTIMAARRPGGRVLQWSRPEKKRESREEERGREGNRVMKCQPASTYGVAWHAGFC